MTKDIIEIIDDLKYDLKPLVNQQDPIAKELNDAVNGVINRFVLDQDPHNFARQPKKLPPKIQGPPHTTEEYRAFEQLIFEWVPDQPISVSQLVERCSFNSDYQWKTLLISPIRGALCHLKEMGKIEIDDSIWSHSR